VFEISTYPIISPFYFFGGCVYEIINKVLPNVNLRDFVDPTGDIDVLLNMPAIDVNFSGEIENYLLDENGVMSEFLDNYTRWIINQLKIQLQSIPPLILDRLFENAVQFDVSENEEAVHSDVREHLLDRRVWIVRSPMYADKMIKIQVVVKFENTPESDHIIELVLPIANSIKDSGNLNNSDFMEDFIMIHGFPVQNFINLIKDNLSAMRGRIHFYNNPELRHKLYNHVGRLQFINELAHRSTMLELQFQDNTYTKSNTRRSTTIRGYFKQRTFVGRVLDLMDYLISIRNEGTLSQLSYNGRIGDSPYTPNAMIRSLVQYYSRFFKDRRSDPIPPSDLGRLPRSLSPAEIMSQLYVAEGGFKRRTSRKLKRRKNYGKTRKN
jgi:hypothetical protein